MKKNDRYLNGYKLIYKPHHPSSMKSENWNGYIYEHIYVIEKFLKRELYKDEVVHHLNLDKSDNSIENLLVLSRSMHAKIHNWIAAGAPMMETHGENGVNSGKAKSIRYCFCEEPIFNPRARFCSLNCSHNFNTTKNKPSKEDLQKDLNSMSWLAIGRKYGVSDNAVRKWAKKYGIDKPILSQASSTLDEGAETSGEVKSS